MELLFNKPEAEKSEIKDLLPFTDADLKFTRLKPDIITATNDLIKLIGEPMYLKIVDKYKEANGSASELVYHARYPIAIKAYMLYAPNNDIAHTTNGRKMRSDENEKLPFQWMIDSDNQALEKRYYRALDDLLAHLEPLQEWREKEAYKGLKSLFLNTTDQFDTHFMIQSRLILLKLQPGIKQCERDHIKPRIGQAKFDALKSALRTGTGITDENDLELLELIREACVFHAMAWAMTRLSVTIFPEGILQAYTSDRDTTQIRRPAENQEPQAARLAFIEDAANALLRIEKHVAPPAAPTTLKSIFPDIVSGNNFLSF